MNKFKTDFLPFSVKQEANGLLVIENELIRWEHDPAQGGELCGAYVKNGTGKNLLVRPQYSALCPWVRGGWRQYHYFKSCYDKAGEFTFKAEKDGSVRVGFASKFRDSQGKALEGAAISHSVQYLTNGLAKHEVTLKLTKDLELGHVRIGGLSIRNDMNRLAVRPCSEATWMLEGQHPCQWIELKHCMNRRDLPAYQSRFLPLSILLFKAGFEAIEMSLGDDLAEWDGIGQESRGLALGGVFERRDPACYEMTYAPLESPRPGDIVKKGTYTFHYTMGLPFVRKNIVPLELAACFLKTEKFEERWRSEAELKKLHSYGLDLLRLHNDGDIFGNGIFWRDASYPPYPAGEMKKMDASIAAARKNGIDVVPYFDCKEYHPETPGFSKYGPKSARQVFPGDIPLETYCGTSLYGIQMCLESDWYDVRKKSIEPVLKNHAFNGLYFDWTMGLECVNPNHNHGRRHWDNDRLMKLLTWSRERIGQDGKLYLHLTNVPNMAAENMANMVLTEESEYSEVFPEMFTPHVHFMNIAPRSICVMIPGDLRPLALAALLHHATLCTDSEAVLKLYAAHKKDFAAFTKYAHHTAPGEGIVSADAGTKAGMSLYWKGRKGLAVFANLTDKPVSCGWKIELDGKTVTGKVKLPPLELVTQEVEL